MIWLAALVLLGGTLAYFRSPLWLSAGAFAALLALYATVAGPTAGVIVAWVLYTLAASVLLVPALRQSLISRRMLAFMRGALPQLSRTEQEALEAGDVWWDAELFSGMPDWARLRAVPAPRLSAREQAFIDGPVEELCAMLDDWKITHEWRDLPPSVWAFLREQGFLGMIIPQAYGGLGFSALGHAQVVAKIASRSITAAVTVMVPNSLGPGKLLLEYGTQDQKDHYLPRLAHGEDLPCFALTGPEAGSDAGAIPDTGIVCRDQWQGEEVVGIRLNWDKRYITLGPVATLLGLAFKLYDPEHLIGQEEERGISVALIPTDLPGIEIGNRHLPMDIPFQNGPNRGRDVFIPLDMLIGGVAQAGNGWRMLMECLAEGRGISLPALATGTGKIVARTTGAYARVRKQFKLPIGRFEGIEEPLARLGANTYITDAARSLTAVALDQGERPAVLSAVIKYALTERMRHSMNDAMDIQGGSAICLGPSNYLGRIYQAVPIAITVEGANILTRSMIVFGQGAIRCHPYLLEEIEAAQSQAPDALARFDRAFLRHVGFLVSNLVRTTWLGLTNARLVRVRAHPQLRRYYQDIPRLSAAFALLTDVAMVSLGGSLKRRERLSGRFADVLANLYLASSVLKHFEDQGAQEADLPLVHYSCRETIYRAQQALLAVYWNLPLRPLALVLRALTFPWGKPYRPPHDRDIHAVARLLLEPSEARERLTQGAYISDDPAHATGRVEFALQRVHAAEPLEQRLKQGVRDGRIPMRGNDPDLEAALATGLVDTDEAATIREAREATREAIRVDEFTQEELRGSETWEAAPAGPDAASTSSTERAPLS
jgi:acyl-CoA dehydrogenase